MSKENLMFRILFNIDNIYILIFIISKEDDKKNQCNSFHSTSTDLPLSLLSKKKKNIYPCQAYTSELFIFSIFDFFITIKDYGSRKFFWPDEFVN